MTENLGAQAASAVDEKIREFRNLQDELSTLRNDLGTLMAQRNENEMVKQVRVCVVEGIYVWGGICMAVELLLCSPALAVSDEDTRYYSFA